MSQVSIHRRFLGKSVQGGLFALSRPNRFSYAEQTPDNPDRWYLQNDGRLRWHYRCAFMPSILYQDVWDYKFQDPNAPDYITTDTKEGYHIYPQELLKNTHDEMFGHVFQEASNHWKERNVRTDLGNHQLLAKMDYCFFYIPMVFAIAAAIPSFCCIYCIEEPVFCQMTVKITGRQWYWVYEVESPVDADEEDEDDDE